MMYSLFRLTWRKALVMSAVYFGLLLVHGAVDAMFGVDESVLFLAATLLVPMWAIASAVYTFDSLMIPRGRGWRHPA